MLEFAATLMLLLGAVVALSARQLMRGILGLAVSFIGLAGLFWHLGAYYLAVGQIFLFVGGVVTLFVLAFNFCEPPLQPRAGWPGLLLALLVLASLGAFVPAWTGFPPAVELAELAQMFFGYGWALLAAFLLLFAGVIAAQYLLEVER